MHRVCFNHYFHFSHTSTLTIFLSFSFSEGKKKSFLDPQIQHKDCMDFLGTWALFPQVLSKAEVRARFSGLISTHVKIQHQNHGQVMPPLVVKAISLFNLLRDSDLKFCQIHQLQWNFHTPFNWSHFVGEKEQSKVLVKWVFLIFVIDGGKNHCVFRGNSGANGFIGRDCSSHDFEKKEMELINDIHKAPWLPI